MSFYLSRCIFDSNYAYYNGGALRVGSGATGTLVDCVFKNNHAYQYGGAISIYTSTTTLYLIGYEFDGNYDSIGSHEDIYLVSGFVFVGSSCPTNSFNFGSGYLECPSCGSHYPAALRLSDCRSSTAVITVHNQSAFEKSIMMDRMIKLGTDLMLTSTVYFLKVNFAPTFLTGAVFDGQGLYTIDGGGTRRCFFIDGSGFDVTFKDITITNGYVSSSTTAGGQYGGALFVGSSVKIFLSGVTFSSSKANSGTGGCVYFQSSNEVIMDSCIFMTCASTYGAGIAAGAGVNLEMVDTILSSNSASAQGGALHWGGLYLNAARASFSNNYSPLGGGLYASSGTLNLVAYFFSSNTGTTGKDVYFTGATFVPTDGCASGRFNFGNGILSCFGCDEVFLPSSLIAQEAQPSSKPSPSPTQPSLLPSPSPSSSWSVNSTSLHPSWSPSALPSSSPTLLPTLSPFFLPTHPTFLPTPTPTSSKAPTPFVSTSIPTVAPTQPSAAPSTLPSMSPTDVVSDCRTWTAKESVSAQDELEAAIMFNRTVELMADITLNSQVSILTSTQDRGSVLQGLVFDGQV
jgi:predicted outer membrane repeat protein